MQMPKPIEGRAIRPTGFDFTRRDSLGLKIKDFNTTLKETVDWIKSKPFLNS